MTTQHPHQEIIKAWSEGQSIQWHSYEDGMWLNVDALIAPSFSPNMQYRITPQKAAMPIRRYSKVSVNDFESMNSFGWANDNVQFTFDPYTHKLIDARVI